MPSQLERFDHFHPTVQCALRLQQRSARDRSGDFFADGIRLVRRALDQDAPIRSLLVCERLVRSALGRNVIAEARSQRRPVIDVDEATYRLFSTLRYPQGLGAIMRQQWTPLSQIRPMERDFWVAASSIRSAGNLGSILRTCDAVGARGLIALGPRVDPYDPATVRATMGAQIGQRFVRTTHAKLREWGNDHRIQIVGASPHARRDFCSVGYRRPVVVLIGDERAGLSPDDESLCDTIVRIPMVGMSDSLNVAVATGLILYEVFRSCREK